MIRHYYRWLQVVGYILSYYTPFLLQAAATACSCTLAPPSPVRPISDDVILKMTQIRPKSEK